ncbi:hypothetical protein LTR53_020062, partial [Teratosphaeriaceae sp. CCFEE 6253]
PLPRSRRRARRRDGRLPALRGGDGDVLHVLGGPGGRRAACGVGAGRARLGRVSRGPRGARPGQVM